MGTIIELKDRNLFVNSDYLKNNPEYVEYYQMLIESKNIDDTDVTSIQKNTIKKNIAYWINLSIGEWKADYKKPILVKKGEDGHCDLCNQGGLKTKYKITNKYNGNTMFIGGNCVDKFSEIREAKRIAKNVEQVERLEILRKRFGHVDAVLLDDKYYIEGQKILISKGMESSYYEAKNELENIFFQFIRNKKEPNKKKTKNLISVYLKIKKEVSNFVKQNEHNKHYLPSRYKEELLSQQDDAQVIINDIQNNQGIVSPRIAAKIKIPSYLKSQIKRLAIKIDDPNVNLISAVFGKFILKITRFNEEYTFSVSSEILLKELLSKEALDWDLFFLKHNDCFETMNEETNERLFFLGREYLSSKLDITDINVKTLKTDRKAEIQNYLGDISLFKEKGKKRQNSVLIVFTKSLLIKKSKYLLVGYQPDQYVKNIISAAERVERTKYIERLLSKFDSRYKM